MTPEGKVKEQVKKLLKKYKAYYHMPVQNGMGSPALDFHVCHRGKYIGIETKAPSGRATTRQRLTMQEIWDAGGQAIVINGDEGLHLLEFWLMGDEDGRAREASDLREHKSAV